MLQLGHDAELVAAEIGAVRRQIDLFIPAQQSVHRAENMSAFEFRNQFRIGCFSGHAAIEPRPRPFASAFAGPNLFRPRHPWPAAGHTPATRPALETRNAVASAKTPA